MDCTFCVDCVHACPHSNVGVLRSDRAGLWRTWSNANMRPDHAALILVIVFAAFANAAGMTAPVQAWQDEVALSLGLERFASASLSFMLLFIALPFTLTGIAALGSV